MKRLHCCGRWCFWKRPFGPWACTECERTYQAPMPKSATPAFFDAIDEMAAQIKPLTSDDADFIARCFGGRGVIIVRGATSLDITKK